MFYTLAQKLLQAVTLVSSVITPLLLLVKLPLKEQQTKHPQMIHSSRFH